MKLYLLLEWKILLNLCNIYILKIHKQMSILKKRHWNNHFYFYLPFRHGSQPMQIILAD